MRITNGSGTWRKAEAWRQIGWCCDVSGGISSFFFPIALLACALVSWYSAGCVLKSLQSVEKAAQEITGSNFGLQIPKRGADDELDRLIDSFNEMSGRLKASFEQMRQFSTDVSHELRTPLTAIQGQLEVALFTATRKEQLQEAIENALQDVERLANLVRALLLLSQSESGQIPMNKERGGFERTGGGSGGSIPDSGGSAQYKTDAGGRREVFCEADRTQLERVVTNLLSNAIKYTPPGGWVRATAETAGDERAAGCRRFRRGDTEGSPAAHLRSLLSRSGSQSGKRSGLGFSFVAAIVKAHAARFTWTANRERLAV